MSAVPTSVDGFRSCSRLGADASALPGRNALALLPMLVGVSLLRGVAAERATNAASPAPALTAALDQPVPQHGEIMNRTTENRLAVRPARFKARF